MAPKIDDPTWEFGERLDGTNHFKVKCKLCAKVITGGITRLKEHIAGKQGNVAQCNNATSQHVRICRELLDANTQKKKHKAKVEEVVVAHVMEDIYRASREEQFLPSGSSGSDEGELGETKEDWGLHRAMIKSHRVFEMRDHGGAGGSGGGTSSKKKSGWWSKWTSMKKLFCKGGRQAPVDPNYAVNLTTVCPIGPTWDRPQSLRQMRIDPKVAIGIAATKYFIDAHRPLSDIDNPYFRAVCLAAAGAGSSLSFPTPYELSTYFIPREVERIREWVGTFKRTWEMTGVTVMTDGWRSNDKSSIVNFLIYNHMGTVFHKSIDTSGINNDSELLCNKMLLVCEEVNPDNVVHIVTDNGSTFKKPGEDVSSIYPWIFWTPCAAHCIDLILKDFSRDEKMRGLLDRCKDVTDFIYYHSKFLEVMRKYTNHQELLQPGVARFATNIITLPSFLRNKEGLMKMTRSKSYWGAIDPCYPDQKTYAESIAQILQSSIFWDSVVYAIIICRPLVKVLQLVDGDERPTLPYVFDAILRARNMIDKVAQSHRFREMVDARISEHFMGHPQFLAAFFLNPFSPPIEDLTNTINYSQVINAVNRTLDIMVCPDPNNRAACLSELHLYENRLGSFGDSAADVRLPATSKMSADQWWIFFGQSAPHLRKYAVRLLSQTCSASNGKRNWSAFKNVHNKPHSRLSSAKPDILYIRYNQRLKAYNQWRYSEVQCARINLDHLFAYNDPLSEWINEDEPPVLHDLDAELYHKIEMEVVEGSDDGAGVETSCCHSVSGTQPTA